jgi:1-acyl-sn-glycerol-3-phosphate acyltransferase
LLGPDVEFKVKARAAIALLWECHGWIWHGYEIVGFENLPADKRALVVYYHGVIPVDYYYLSARYSIKYKRTIWTIAANFLFKTPGLRGLMDVVQATPGTVQQIADLLRKDEIVSVAPGGVREAQFSNEYYELVWNGHLGFAKAACLGKAPIIPVFTQNVREAYRTAPFFRGFFRKIFEKTKLPLLPVYGGFPVKLRTIIGEPIPYDEKATPEEVAERTAEAIRELIRKHQRLPGSILSAMLDRIR